MKKKNTKETEKILSDENRSLIDVAERSKWFRRVIFLMIFLACGYFFVNSGIKSLIGTIIIAAMPLFIGLAIAWISNPFVKKLMKKGWRRKSAGALIFLGVFVIGVVATFFIAPIIVNQARDFWQSVISDGDQGFRARMIKVLHDTFGMSNASEFVTNVWEDAESYITENWSKIAVNALPIIGGMITTLVMGIAIGYYLLSDYDNYKARIKESFPNAFKDKNGLVSDLNFTLRGWAKGWLLDQLFVFSLTLIVLMVLGVEQFLILALIMVAFNTIPFIGPIIGSGIIIIFLFVTYLGLDGNATELMFFGPGLDPLFVIIFGTIAMIVIQTLESVWWVPRVYGKTVNIHPITTLVGLGIVGAVFSPFLMPLTIPAVAVIKVVYRHKANRELPL